MDKTPDFSMADAMRLARTPAGQQLIALLQQQDGTDMQQALNQAASGNYQQAKEQLLPLLQSPQIQALLKQLGG